MMHMIFYFLFFVPLAIQTCVSLLKIGRPAPHHEARQKRRELRQKQQAEQEQLELRMKELQTANESKQRELEAMRKVCNTLIINPIMQTSETLLSFNLTPNSQHISSETIKPHTMPNLI